MKEKMPDPIENETLCKIEANIWKKFDAIVAKNDFSLRKMKGVQYNIYLKTDKPVRQAFRTILNKRIHDLKAEIEEILWQGVIEKSNSEYVFNIVMVRKPNGK